MRCDGFFRIQHSAFLSYSGVMPRVDPAQFLSEAVLRLACAPFDDGGGRIVVKAAPGRLDVMGALGADTGGTVAQMALPARVAVAVQASGQSSVIAHSEGVGEVRIALEGIERGEGLVAGDAAFGMWLLAAWRALCAAGVALPAGARVRVQSAVPMGAGQGSSTAMLVALVLGIVELCNVKMEVDAIAKVVGATEGMMKGEGGSNRHVMDALTCQRAEAGTMLRFSAQPHRLVGPVPIPRDLRVLALDTGVRSATSRETLEELRLAGAMGVRMIDTIYRDLGQVHTPLHGYLANTSPLLYRQYFRTLMPKRLRGSDFLRTYGPLDGGTNLDAARFYRVRTAVDHLIAEHEHAEQFLQAMEELADMPGWGDVAEEAERQRTLQRAGRLALASHHSYRLRLELSCKEADWLVDHLMEAGSERGIYGARITGSGGGGTVMALVDRGQQSTDAVLGVMKAYSDAMGLTLRVTEAGAGAGGGASGNSE